MSRRPRVLPSIAMMLVLAGAVGIGGAASAASAAPETPRTVQASFEFTDLIPGVEQSTLKPFSIEKTARVTSAQAISSDQVVSDFVWTSQLCDADGDGCRPFDATLTGTTLQAGAHTVRVGVTMTAWGESTSSTALARLVFADASSSGLPLGLASTGVPVLGWVAIAATILAVGMLLLTAAQRRRSAGDDAASAAASVTASGTGVRS